jgi:hypothetical protein
MLLGSHVLCSVQLLCVVAWPDHNRPAAAASCELHKLSLAEATAAADTHLAGDEQVALLVRLTTAALGFTGSYAAVLRAQLRQRSEPREVAQPHERQLWAKQDVQRRQPCNTMRPSTLELCRGVPSCMHVPSGTATFLRLKRMYL